MEAASPPLLIFPSGSACGAPARARMRGPLGSLGAGCETERREEGSAARPARRLRLRDSGRDAFSFPPSQHPTPSSSPPRAPPPASCARPVGVGGGVETGRGRVSREGRSEPESVVLRRSEGGKMADRFSRFNEDRDFQVNTGVAEEPPRRARSEPRAAPLLFSRLPFLLLSAPPCKPALPSLISLGASQAEMRPRLRLHPCSCRLLNSGFLLFALGFPLPSRALCGGCALAVSGPVQARGWPPGERARVGEAGASGFSGQGYGTPCILLAPSSWESSLRFLIVINKPFIVYLT